MENGFDWKLAEKLSSLELNDQLNISENDNLFQVMKAVEAAEATIKQQVEENDRLRTELQVKTQELEKHKSYEQPRRWGKNIDGTYGDHESTTSAGNSEDGINIKSLRRSSLVDQQLSPFPYNDSVLDVGGIARENSTAGHFESNGTMKLISSHQIPADVPVLTQFSSPSTSSISLSRYQTEAEYNPRFNSYGHGLMPMAEANNSNRFPMQDLLYKVREHEQEIAQLRRYLTEFSVREAQIHNENSVLEKRIAYMRLAFDQQQQDLVDASSKALSYRQDIMEENIRLSYQLQAAQQDRLTFVSSLLPLLAEYSLQPPAPDAHSIVSNVKVLFKHLQEQLHITESKLKNSQFQLAPWSVEATPSQFAIQSPNHLVVDPAPNKDVHELVAKPNFIPSKPPPSSDARMAVQMDRFTEDQAGLGGLLQRNMAHDEVGRYSPLANRHPIPQSPHREYDNARGNAQKPMPSEEPPKQVQFRVPVSSIDDRDAAHQNEPEISATWNPGNDDQNFSYSPNLQPVLEEPSSSFSEGPDDDPLPAVDGLQISGDAIPGRELQASGLSINGTNSCNFEWVRHIADGSVTYIEGARQPSYLVTADDVDNYLAIEVQPLDNRKRKGEPVKVFANDNMKISLEPGMQACLEAAHNSGIASFRVELSTGYLDIWESAILTIKRDGYTIKSNALNGITITEKFSRDTMVTIPYGHPTVFSVSDSNYEENILRSESGPEDVSNCRDTIVLILRLFIMRAGQKPTKGKRKGLFTRNRN